MNPILKWPGGKSAELSAIRARIPPHARYLEPFFGGGAVYFALAPERAAINDLSAELMGFYGLLRAGDAALEAQLSGYAAGFAAVRSAAMGPWLSPSLALLERNAAGARILPAETRRILEGARIEEAFAPVETEGLLEAIAASAADKFSRTARLHQKSPLSAADLARNAAAGYLAGVYLHARAAYNRLQSRPADDPARAAAFFFVREYCYGAMFRYNRAGAFNIPYGGASYNEKDFAEKARAAFAPDVRALLTRTALHCGDFSAFFAATKPGEGDFLFLDPPYDSAFSAYGGHAFTMEDQARLAEALRTTEARFLLVIRDTPRIRALYEGFARVETIPHRYTYNVRGRNAQAAAHLYIMNYE